MRNFLIFLTLSFLTLVVTWPLILHLNNNIIDVNDGLLITWFLNRPLQGNLWHYYDANIFYPYANTLAFSETMLPQAWLSIPIVRLTGEPLLAYNLNFLLGFILTAFSTYLLVKLLTKKAPAAFLVAILFTFSTIHLNYMAHLQLFNFWPVVLAIYFLFKSQPRFFSLFFVIASLTTVLNFYFLLLFSSVAFLKKAVDRTILAKALVFGVLFTIPFLIPYYEVTKQFHYVRPINDAINFSLQFSDLANVSIYNHLSALVSQIPNRTPAYFGTVFTVLILLLFILKKGASVGLWLWTAGAAFTLALGPALHIWPNTVHVGPLPAIPLPYAIFYYLVPGFSGLRTPSRWILLTAFALSLAIAIRFAKKINWKVALILSALVIAEINFPFKYHDIPSVRQFPPEQKWLTQNYPGAPIAQFPIYGWFDGDEVSVETLRMYYSTIHWHPMFNGYSGFSPREWEDRVKWLQQNFPNGETIGFLRDLGIKLVLVPKDWDVSSVQNELELVASFPKTNVYTLNSRFSQK